jgi:acyl-CoA hydrolase
VFIYAKWNAWMTAHYNQYRQAAKIIIENLDKKVVIGVPLGLGKPVGLLNALYLEAESDPSIQLTILTALTLARPTLHNVLEKRFVEPFLDRILKDYEDLLYEKARERQQLPHNITVIEFFLSTAKFLNNSYVQQNYISTSYTDAARDVANLGLNVLAQQVSHTSVNADHYSLSCNSDLFHDVIKHIQQKGHKYRIVAEVNNKLPFMHGEAVIKTAEFTDIVDTQQYRTLFSVPHDEISVEDHLIGFYTSLLIKDDSCLQIGIGKLSNALTASLIMRHNNNADYQNLMTTLAVQEKFGEITAQYGESGTFEKGLYASTEMLCDGYLQLYKEKILKKKVYDHVGLQKLINDGQVRETFAPDILEQLFQHKIINNPLCNDDVVFLKKYGIFKSDIRFENDCLILASGESIAADWQASETKKSIITLCMGSNLKSGTIIHAAFFLGTSELYEELNNLSIEELETIDMTSVARTNSMSWWPELLTLQRQHTRFVNSAMMVTLGCAIVSDGLIDLQEVSGVGGQFDFVDMVSNLPESRSIINCRSVRTVKNTAESNIVWEYSNVTIPRFLRDIVITEYGIADCRSKTDAEVIKTLLNVTDSRFQASLLNTAKQFGKIATDYEIPQLYRNNLPSALAPHIQTLQTKGYFEPYPFGTELTSTEQILKKVLLYLKNSSSMMVFKITLAALFYMKQDKEFMPYLQRMQLDKPVNVKDYLYKKIFKYLLRQYL